MCACVRRASLACCEGVRWKRRLLASTTIPSSRKWKSTRRPLRCACASGFASPRPAGDRGEALLELCVGADVGVAVEELLQWPDAGLRAERLERLAQFLGVDEVPVGCLV